MRKLWLPTLALIIGCSTAPEQRPETITVNGTVKLHGGHPVKGLTITFFPVENNPPAGAKCNQDGTFTLQATPGDYLIYFDQEANAKTENYKSIPMDYRRPKETHRVTISKTSRLDILIE